MSHSDKVFHRTLAGREQIVVVLFSFLILCILVATLTFFALSLGKSYIGVSLSMNERGWAVDSVDANGLASQVGINKGDKPVEVNGQPAQIFLEKYRETGAVFDMLLKELTVIDNTGQLKSVTLKGGSLTWQSIIDHVARSAVTLIFWIIGFHVFLKRPRSVSALLLLLCGLIFGLVISGNMAAEIAVPTAFELQVVATIVGPWLLLHLFLVLPEERAWLHNKPILYLIYLPVAITLILFFTVGYANGQPIQWFRDVRMLEIGVGFMAAVGIAIFNYFDAVSPRTKQQMKVVSIGCFAALIPNVVLYLAPEAIWGWRILPPEFSILTIAFIPLGMGYAVVTQKLLDIDIVIRRGVIYGLITVVMAVVLSVGIFLVVNFKGSLGLPQEILIALVLGGLATALFGPVKNGIELMIDRFFYKDRYDYRQIIQSLSISLNSLKDFTDISRLIVGTTVHTLNLAGGCLFFSIQSGYFQVGAAEGIFIQKGKQKKLSNLISQRRYEIEFPNSALSADSEVAFLVPLIAGEREVGILCLSEKVSRQNFTSNDLYLLQGIASVAAIALHGSMLIRDVSIRDTFISVASHELRIPMTSIMGYAELLLSRDPTEDKRKRWITHIFNNSQRINTMVDDLLNVSRIQSGKVSINLKKISLTSVLEEVLSLIRETTDKHEFVVDIEPDLPDAIVDNDKFNHILRNLLSNAIKYSPNGGRIMLSAYYKPKEHRIILSVTDEGIGISPADKDLLFTTFHRIQRPETQGIRGSGLGLYIAKEWTEAMGGKIWLESELNKGSTFFITIPTQDYRGVG